MRFSSTAMRIATFFAASFVSYGIHLPFFPVLLAARGLDEASIAMIVAVPMVLRVSTASALGSLADRLGDRRRALVLYSTLTLAGWVTLWPATGFWTLLLGTAATSLAWNGILPVSDAMAIGVVRRGEGVYGRMRVWGSIAFVVANLGAGWAVAWGGAEVAYHLVLASFVLQLACALAMPSEPVRAQARAGEPTLVALRRLVADRRLVAILIGAAILQSSHAMLYGFSSLYWRTLGFGGDTIGVLWATSVIGEILLFAGSGPVVALLGARGLLLIGGTGSVLRWALFPMLGSTLPAWLALQGLHAASFAMVHLGAIQVVTQRVADQRAATAQGMMTSINASVMAVVTLIAGAAYGRFGGAAFGAMAVIALVGVITLMVATRRQPQSTGLGGKRVDPS